MPSPQNRVAQVVLQASQCLHGKASKSLDGPDQHIMKLINDSRYSDFLDPG